MEYLALTTIFHLFVFLFSLTILYLLIIDPSVHKLTYKFIRDATYASIASSKESDLYLFCNLYKSINPHTFLGTSYKNSNNILLIIFISLILFGMLVFIIDYIYCNKIYKNSNFATYIIDLLLVAGTLGGIEFMFFYVIGSKYNTYADY